MGFLGMTIENNYSGCARFEVEAWGRGDWPFLGVWNILLGIYVEKIARSDLG
jgi:hypothetical protein